MNATATNACTPGARAIERNNTADLSYDFQYLDKENATLVTDSLGRTERYQFEGSAGLKRLVAHTRADGTVQRYRYDAAGRKVEETDPLGRTTSWMHDTQGQVVGVHYADGTAATQAYDLEGNLSSQTGPDGAQWRYAHDAWGRLILSTAPDDTTTAWRYPEVHPGQRPPANPERPTEIVDAQGGVKTLQWSAVGQLLSYTDCSGHTTRYQYGPSGETTAVTDALGQSVRYEYAANG